MANGSPCTFKRPRRLWIFVGVMANLGTLVAAYLKIHSEIRESDNLQVETQDMLVATSRLKPYRERLELVRSASNYADYEEYAKAYAASLQDGGSVDELKELREKLGPKFDELLGLSLPAKKKEADEILEAVGGGSARAGQKFGRDEAKKLWSRHRKIPAKNKRRRSFKSRSKRKGKRKCAKCGHEG